MNFNSVVFENAYGTFEQMPESSLPEICFSGRSNVGKSSIINKIIGRKSLARVSTRPGKTVTVNFYRLDEFRISDLPGYGYAKVDHKEKMRWSELMEGYFSSGRNIAMVFQLLDMRHKPTEDDISMIEFLDYNDIPYTIVLTKCDKLNKGEYQQRLNEFTAQFGDNIALIPTSALKGDGVDTIRGIITQAVSGIRESE